MTTLREAAELALKAIEQGETFGYLENVVAPTLEAALKEDSPTDFSHIDRNALLKELLPHIQKEFGLAYKKYEGRK
jgi:hypothetical protein